MISKNKKIGWRLGQNQSLNGWYLTGHLTDLWKVSIWLKLLDRLQKEWSTVLFFFVTKATRLVCIWDDFAHTKFGWKMILKQLAGKQFEFRRDLHLSQGLLNSIDQDYRGPNHPFLYWICHLGVGIWNPHFELVLTRPHKPSLDLIHLTNIFLSLVYEIPSNKMA